MKIPMLNMLSKEVILPVSKQTVKIRPYLVGEEKIILMAIETRDPTESTAAVKKLIKECIIEPKKLDIDSMSTLDVEFIFLELRKMSVDSKAKIGITHQNPEYAEKCTHVQEVTVDLNEVKIAKFDGNIELQEGAKVLMRLPSYRDIEQLQNETSEVKKVFTLIQKCLDTIYLNDLIIHTKDHTPDEVNEWVNNLNNDQFLKLNSFFNNIPQITYDLDYTCEKCGKTEHIEIKGLQSFL